MKVRLRVQTLPKNRFCKPEYILKFVYISYSIEVRICTSAEVKPKPPGTIITGVIIVRGVGGRQITCLPFTTVTRVRFPVGEAFSGCM